MKYKGAKEPHDTIELQLIAAPDGNILSIQTKTLGGQYARIEIDIISMEQMSRDLHALSSAGQSDYKLKSSAIGPDDFPQVTFREDIMRLHTLFLEKLESLTDIERAAFIRYFDALSAPAFSFEMPSIYPYFRQSPATGP